MNSRPAHAPQPLSVLQRAIGGAGALLFGAALAYFLYSYGVTFGEIATGDRAFDAVVTNVALFSIFALHHSVFARQRIRAAASRILSPAYERTAYVSIASLMLIGVCAWWQPVPGIAWQAPRPASWLLYAVQALGVWLSLRSAAMLGIRELAGLQPATSTPTTFRTDGPYGWVRHPIYLGWFLIVFAVGTMTMTRLVFAIVSCAYVLIGLHLEERTLRASSDGGYADYMRKVPRKLLPGVY